MLLEALRAEFIFWRLIFHGDAIVTGTPPSIPVCHGSYVRMNLIIVTVNMCNTRSGCSLGSNIGSAVFTSKQKTTTCTQKHS